LAGKGRCASASLNGGLPKRSLCAARKLVRKALPASIVDPGQPQLLDQAVLQGAERPLDPALGSRRIGADDVDVELVQRPA